MKIQFWKQFTTGIIYAAEDVVLWIINENTILKAIHNVDLLFYFAYYLWIINENTILKAIHNKPKADWW